MKIKSFVAALMVLTVSLCCTQSFAQQKGIAADKEKQAALDKNLARQAEMKRKYNSMTPEQAAEARKRANEYKNGGYKNKDEKGIKPAASTKPAPVPAARPSLQNAGGTKPAQAKPSATKSQGSTKPKPVFMDANGKPLKATTPAAVPPKTASPAAEPVKAAPAKTVTPKAAKEAAPAVETSKKK